MTSLYPFSPFCSVRRGDGHRGVLLPLRGHAVQAADVLLRGHHLRSHLHDRLRVLDELLAGPQVRPRPRHAHHHHAARHVHHHRQHQQLTPTRRLHQGDQSSHK